MIARFCAAVAAVLIVFAALPAWADVTGTVRGTVTVDGAPAANVSVTLAGEGTSTAAVTDARGHFTFAHVAFGRYAVRAQGPGKATAESAVDVSTDSVADITLALGANREIGRTSATTRGVGGNPLSVTTLSAGRARASTG